MPGNSRVGTAPASNTPFPSAERQERGPPPTPELQPDCGQLLLLRQAQDAAGDGDRHGGLPLPLSCFPLPRAGGAARQAIKTVLHSWKMPAAS